MQNGDGIIEDNEKQTGFKTVKEGGKEFIVSKLKGKPSFTGMMIIKNKIEPLLRTEVREFNGESFIYYDVSGRMRFSDMFFGENDIMEREDIERLCRSFEKLVIAVSDHLLDLDEARISPETLFYDPENKIYEFLYLPGNGSERTPEYDDRGESGEVYEEGNINAAVAEGGFNDGVRSVWARVMEKFNHQSEMESIARVYDIYRKISMQSFDPAVVFAPMKSSRMNQLTGDESADEKERRSQSDAFSRESLKASIAGDKCPEEEKSTGFAAFAGIEDEGKPLEEAKKITAGGLFEGLKMKLAGSAGFFKGSDNRINEDRISEISKTMDQEEKLSFKIKDQLAKNSGNIFKIMMCTAVLFLILAVLPESIGFKPPVSACIGVFLVSVAVAVYARKLGKDMAEEKA